MNDLISRQAAIDALIAEGRNVDSRYLESERIIHESDAVEALSMLPSAQLERKRGKWIYDGTKRICPFCKDFIVTGRSIVKYCWNCGAKMDGKETEDETDLC